MGPNDIPVGGRHVAAREDGKIHIDVSGAEQDASFAAQDEEKLKAFRAKIARAAKVSHRLWVRHID